MLLFVFYKHVSFSMTGDSVLSFCFSGHESLLSIFFSVCVCEREKGKKSAINLDFCVFVVGME